MPASFINDPMHWRDRAEELRRLTEEMANEKTKQNHASHCEGLRQAPR
jgi:hypothetical protein